jgi:hypothetical protein
MRAAPIYHTYYALLLHITITRDVRTHIMKYASARIVTSSDNNARIYIHTYHIIYLLCDDDRAVYNMMNITTILLTRDAMVKYLLVLRDDDCQIYCIRGRSCILLLRAGGQRDALRDATLYTNIGSTRNKTRSMSNIGKHLITDFGR